MLSVRDLAPAESQTRSTGEGEEPSDFKRTEGWVRWHQSLDYGVDASRQMASETFADSNSFAVPLVRQIRSYEACSFQSFCQSDDSMS